MQIAADVTAPQSIPGATTLTDVSSPVQPAFSQYKIIRRNGAVVGFEPGKISVAVTKAFLAVEGGQSAASARIRELVSALTDAVVGALVRRQPGGGTFHIEDIQDQVELALMRSGEHEVARAYVLYREKRAEARAHEAAQKKPAPQAQLHTVEDGTRRPLDLALLGELIASACEGLGAALDASRDLKFGYLGLQTLYDRYFLHIQGTRIELPQAFFMRVAMGLALNEVDREARAVEFYNVLSSFDFMSSTPTLFNSGTLRSQLSSCYLTTVSDDLDGIYEAIKENALLAKYAGGLGNDWTPVRALGSHIKWTNGKSQAVVPLLNVVHDTAVAVNQGGKRQGAVCSYLETWHLDIEQSLEHRKDTGAKRRRTHDLRTA